MGRRKERAAMGCDLSNAVDALPGLIWIAFPDGGAEYLNQRWCEYTGLSLDEASGNGWQRAVHPDDLPQLSQSWQSAIASGQPNETEARLRRFDGVYRWFLFRGNPVFDSDGQLVRWWGINTDIEARKRAEDALLKHEQRFRIIVDGLPVSVVLVDPLGKMVHANPYARELGFSLEHLSSWATSDFIHPDDRQAVIDRVQACFSTGQPYESEARNKLADGNYHWLHLRGFPLRDESGGIVLWYFLVIQIDDRKRDEALLAGEKRLLEMTALGMPLLEILGASCRLVEEVSHGCHGSVHLVDPIGKILHRGVASDLAAPYVDIVNRSPITSEAGPCGMAACSKTQVIVQDVASETRWSPAWRDLCLAHGIRACWSTPILSRGNEVVGIFTIHRVRPGVPDQLQLELIGRIAHVASIAIERSGADVALRTSSESLRTIAETTPDCVMMVARDGTVLRINSVGGDLLGAEGTDALIGKCMHEMVTAEHRQRYIEFNERVCQGQRAIVEFDIVTMSGERRSVETHAAPMRSGNGPVVQLAVTRDITARKHAEEQLRRSEALMAKAQRLSSSGSFSWRPASGEINWSEQLYRIFEIDPAVQITLEEIATRVHPADLHLQINMVERAQSGRNLEFDHRLLLPDGSVKYLHMEAHPIRDQQGRLEYIGAVQDVTSRHLSEEALSELRAELTHVSRINTLGLLTASIAHEINQPLAGIIANASTCLRMLSADRPNVEGALETVRRTIRDGRRASDVVTRLRTLYKKKPVTSGAVDLNDAASEVADLLRSEIRKSRIALRQEYCDGMPAVVGDRVQLQQVMLNLLMNAMEAMDGIEDRARLLLIKSELDGDAVRLSVSDTGPGFDPADANKLFQAFYTTKREGMGIGLCVSRSIIESHGGRLWAMPNEGFGSTFLFSIPQQTVGVAEVDCVSAATSSLGGAT
jgi:PAS domain S-box-containing protein